MERNLRIFKDKAIDLTEMFEKNKFSASFWGSTDKAFKDFPFSLIVVNWKDGLGN